MLGCSNPYNLIDSLYIEIYINQPCKPISTYIIAIIGKWLKFNYILLAQELTEEGRNAIELPASPLCVDLGPEHFLIGYLIYTPLSLDYYAVTISYSNWITLLLIIKLVCCNANI